MAKINDTIIDNNRVILSDVLKEISKEYKNLSIATGYWDLAGTIEIIEEIKKYDSVRLIIGKEPYRQLLKNFPKFNIKDDIELYYSNLNENERENIKLHFQCVITLKKMIENNQLEVKILNEKRFLHAKCYIFGNYESDNAIGIIGSSNFTYAGLNSNLELNSLENDYQKVTYTPRGEKQGHGHLSWFDEVWNSEDAIEWSGEFIDLLRNSPVGDLTYGAYDVYIKTLMEIYPDELIPKPNLEEKITDVLFSFQNRNAGILINKLEKMGLAMLADSVGLGKTITAGAVIRHYISLGAKRIIVIVPASLKQQWINDLLQHHELIEGSDFKIVSIQNLNEIENIREIDKFKEVDLFVIDEAHNLRNQNSTRYQMILDWFLDNLSSKVLLLTATPINNSLIDVANQLQLGLKGQLDSVNVPVKKSTGGYEIIDFFAALQRIESNIKKEKKKFNYIDFQDYKLTFQKGLGHYLVRSTRQGVESEGGIVFKDGRRMKFPNSIISSYSHEDDQITIDAVKEIVYKNIDDIYEGINPLLLNVENLSNITQISLHPLDFLKKSFQNEEYLYEQFNFDDSKSILQSKETNGYIPIIFSIINLLGFVPYRSKIYQRKYYGKPLSYFSKLKPSKEISQIRVQLAIHNILHVTWLKRAESSNSSLFKSLNNYNNLLNVFTKYLSKGYIINFSELSKLEDDYSGDIDEAFADYEEYLKEIDEAIANNEPIEEIKKKGVEKIIASDKEYDIEQLEKDINREVLLVENLLTIIEKGIGLNKDNKLKKFIETSNELISQKKFGKKILIFSYFADTIEYLEKELSNYNLFKGNSEFISSKTLKVENLARRFSPISKNYKEEMIKKREKEIDFLFATDVLSEGQNLQDAGIIINYDLHWNPVRMIQRNGRVNRLGSKYKEIMIANLKPASNLELYLKLVSNLEGKIEVIRHSIGTDQSILGEKENPIEFIEKLYKGKLTSKDLEENPTIFDENNEYIEDLRLFLATNSEEEIERVKQIPLGKWNYLPDKKNSLGTKIISLNKIIGITSITNKPIEENYFIVVNPDDEFYKASILEDEKALEMIKANKDDNMKYNDEISVDRILVSNQAKIMAKINAESYSKKYEFQKSETLALLELLKYSPDGIDLSGLLSSKITNSQEKRKIRKILLQVNKELRENGVILSRTQTEFIKFYKEMEAKIVEDNVINEVKGVLFYANKV